MALNTTPNSFPFNVGATGLRSPLLNPNEIYQFVFNMIISQTVHTGNIKGTYGSLAERFKVDGTMYGDTKLFYATNVLSSRPWTGDAEASNLLALKRAPSPKVQAIQINQARIIELTVDNYLTKRAWSTPDAFSTFNGAMIAWMADTKRVYESRLINTFVGNTVSNATRATISIDLTTAAGSASTEEESRRLQAQEIAKDIADLLVDLKDTTEDFNDYKFLRSYTEDDFYYVFNSKYVNQITKLDLPTIFHKDGLVDKMGNDILPTRYFGRAVTASDKGSGKLIDGSGYIDPTKGTIRSLIESTFTINSHEYHVFPGDDIYATVLAIGNEAASGQGTTDAAAITVKSSGTFEEAEVYIEDNTVIAKIIHKEAVPFMGAFETNTSFFNPISLTDTKYLIWMYSEPEYLKDLPFLTLKKI